MKRSERRRLVRMAASGLSEMFLQGNAKSGGVRLGVRHNEIFIPVGYSFRTVALAERHGKRLTGRNPKRWEKRKVALEEAA